LDANAIWILYLYVTDQRSYNSAVAHRIGESRIIFYLIRDNESVNITDGRDIS